MAGFRYSLVVSFLVVFTFFPSSVKGVLEIVQPLPGHQVAIEGEQVKATCIALDYENITTPLEILFYKVTNRFGDKDVIKDAGPNGNFTFESKTEENGMKLSVTIIINKMNESLKDGYVCSAFYNATRNGKKEMKRVDYGFGISYIPKKDLPSIQLSNDVITEFGKSATLTCNLTKASHQSRLVVLDKIAWYKNNELRNEVTHLEDKTLKDIDLQMNNTEDAGKYTCRLFTTLQGLREYSIAGTITVKIAPKFMAKELDDNEIIRKKGESVRFSCDAQGNPINITWKKKPKSGDETILNNTASMKNDSDSHYKFSNDEGRLEGFWLEIPKTDYSDRGEYKCCFRTSSNSSSKEQCQTFTLRVKDPLGYLWPLIGIIVQAILIVIILVVAAKLKSKSSASASKTVKQTELHYTIQDEGGKGHIRLRNKRLGTT